MNIVVSVLLAATMFALSSCSLLQKTTKCTDTKTVTSPFVSFVASPAGLNCDHPNEIQADVEDFLASLKVCEAPPHGLPEDFGGPIGSLVCPPLVAWGVSHWVDNSERLKRWGCKGTGIKVAFAAACQFIPI